MRVTSGAVLFVSAAVFRTLLFAWIEPFNFQHLLSGRHGYFLSIFRTVSGYPVISALAWSRWRTATFMSRHCQHSQSCLDNEMYRTLRHEGRGTTWALRVPRHLCRVTASTPKAAHKGADHIKSVVGGIAFDVQLRGNIHAVSKGRDIYLPNRWLRQDSYFNKKRLVAFIGLGKKGIAVCTGIERITNLKRYFFCPACRD